MNDTDKHKDFFMLMTSVMSWLGQYHITLDHSPFEQYFTFIQPFHTHECN